MKAMKPYEIEQESFRIITQELGPCSHSESQLMVLKRVIHTTADFSYKDSLYFSQGAMDAGLKAISGGCTVVTDTNMALSGINKPGLAKGGSKALCFMGDTELGSKALELGCTRASLCMDKAVEIDGPLIIAVGNAPTALLRLNELIEEGKIKPELIIAVPVGFVNVVESKELIVAGQIPCIVARGRKGGSNVAAAIVNALSYLCFPRDSRGQ